MIYSIFYKNLLEAPEQVALVKSNGETLSYFQANEQILTIALVLSEQGISQGDRVGVLLDDEDCHVLLFLALDRLKASYVPFDVDIPSAQLKKDLSVLALKTVISDKAFLIEKYSIGNYFLMNTSGLSQLSSINQLPEYSSQPIEHISYLVSSSGTTSQKKWIPILENGLLYWQEILKQQVKLNKSDKVLASRSPAFDARIFEYLMAFSAACPLFLMNRNSRKDFFQIQNKCQENNITAMLFIASNLSSKSGLDVLCSLKSSGMKHLFVTGDASTLELKNKCELLDINLWNAYGPTEATFGLSLKLVNGFTGTKKNLLYQIPIGKPLGEGVNYHLINSKLYIESPYLSPGYINSTESNNNFLMVSDDNGKCIRLFDTGDMFDENADELFYLGEYDNESHCKINGVKVLPNFVQQCILEYNQRVNDVHIDAVVVKKKQLDKVNLFAYLVIKGDLNKTEFHAFLSDNLRKEEIPTFIALERLPLLINSGKVDKRQLIERIDDVDAWYEGCTYEAVEQRSELYVTVAGIWQEILGREIIPANVDFLFLGGNSIKSIEMIHCIQQSIDPDFQYSDLLNLNQITLGSVVQSLEKKIQFDNSMANITKLYESNTSSENLFFLPALLGDGKFSYSELIKGMVKFPKFFDKTMYGLSDPGLYDHNALPETFDEAIDRYVKAIKSIQPKGPYRLVGFSFGATLAHGVASVLEANGEQVNDMHLLDAVTPMLYQKLDNASHFKLFNALIEFLIPVLNNDYYREKVNTFKIKRGGELSPAQQIKASFTYLKRKAVNPNSLGLLNIAERHLEFMLSNKKPQQKLSVVPKIYFTQKEQNYLSIINEVGLSPFDIEYKAYFWNHYFHGLRRNANTLACQHLGVISNKYNASNYWQHGYFTTYDFDCDTYGPMPFFKIEEVEEEVTELSIYFLSSMALSFIKDFFTKNEIDSNTVCFDKSYNDCVKKDFYVHNLFVLYCTLSKAKLEHVCQWLSALSIKQKQPQNSAQNLDNAVKHHPSSVSCLNQQLNHIDLNLGLSQQLIDMSFSFKVDIDLAEVYQKLEVLAKGRACISQVEANRLQFFKPMQTPSLRESIEQESEFVSNFVDIILKKHPI